MRKFKKYSFFISTSLILIFILAFHHSHVHAQQTIISVPSSEVMPAGEMIFKESNGFSPFTPGRYAGLTPSATFGVGKGFEVSTGVRTMFKDGTEVRGDIAAKKVWFLGSSTRLTVGGMINPYFNEPSRPNTFAFAHVSQRIKKTRTSITAGTYIYGQNSFPDKVGALVGLEQVLIPNKLRLAFDWMTGEDSYGKMGVGLKYRPVPTVSIASAVIVPNNDSDNIGFNFSVSKFVSIKDISSLKRRL